MTSSTRLDDVLHAQKTCDLIHSLRSDLLFRADAMLEEATCVLSYPKWPSDVRSRIAEFHRLVALASGEADRLEAVHRKIIDEYAFELWGLSPGMVIRPAKKPKDRCVGVSRFSVDEDGVLTASGWRVTRANRTRTKRFWDFVGLVTGLWSLESGQSVLPSTGPEGSYPWPRHDKSWDMLVEPSLTGLHDSARSTRLVREAIDEIGRSRDALARSIERFSTRRILQDHDIAEAESATVDSVLAAVEPFPTIAQALRSLNTLADAMDDEPEWGECLCLEQDRLALDLLTVLYGVKAGDRLSVRYPKGHDPASWHTVVVTQAWECDGGRQDEMVVRGNNLRKDGTIGKKDGYVRLIPYEVEWRLLDPVRESEARSSKYGDAKWCPSEPVIDYDTPEETLKLAGGDLSIVVGRCSSMRADCSRTEFLLPSSN